MKKTIILLLITLAFFVNAQDGTLDTSFGNNGKVDYSIFSSFVDMKLDYNGKIVALGKNSSGTPILVRYNEDGSHDTTFDGDGIKEINFGNSNETPASFCIYDFNSTESGYLVASSLNGSFAKIKDDGSFANFGVNGIYKYNLQTYSSPHPVVMTLDYQNNKILIGSSEITGSYATYVYRLNENGSNDTSFNNGNPVIFYFDLPYTPGMYINSITVGNAGIYVSGTYYLSGLYSTYSKRINNNGTMSSYISIFSGYDYGGSLSYPGFILDGNDDSSYVYGMDVNDKMMLVKKTSAGVLDATFGTNGKVGLTFPNDYYHNAKSITGHEFGTTFKIILVGRSKPSSGNSNISLARLSSNGILDTSFGSQGITSIPTLITSYSTNLSSGINFINGKLYVMGFTAGTTVSLLRFNLSSVLSTKENQKPTLKLYPNPTKSTLHFSEELSEIKIVDMSGKQVLAAPSKTKIINLEKLPKGNYLLTAKDKNGKTISEKFIKE